MNIRTTQTRAAGGEKPPVAAIGLSAFMFPGAGQVMQGRWLAAIVFAGISIAAASVSFVCIGYVLSVYYRLGDINFNPDFHAPWLPMLGSLVVLIVTWLVNIVDVILAHRRLSRNQREAKHFGGPPPLP